MPTLKLVKVLLANSRGEPFSRMILVTKIKDYMEKLSRGTVAYDRPNSPYIGEFYHLLKETKLLLHWFLSNINLVQQGWLIILTLSVVGGGRVGPRAFLFWFGCCRKKCLYAAPFYILTFQVNTSGHFGISFTFISHSDSELWALKVNYWSNFISMKFFEGQNWRILSFFWIAAVALLDIFLDFFLYSLKECIPKYIE